MFKKFLSILTVLFISTGCAMATNLPNELWDYVQKSFPDAKQRFDSVVELKNGNIYIPLAPAIEEHPENIGIEWSYPKTTTLKSQPEVVVFNNNYVFLKAFKDKNGNWSLTKNENLPFKVRMGIMPQDMLVPIGLQVPESLKVVLGDLIIPSKDDVSIELTEDDLLSDKDKKVAQRRNMLKKVKPISELKNKKMFVSNYDSKFISVYDLDKSDALYELKLNGLPYKIISSNSSKFALVAYFGSKDVEVIDLKNERIVSTISFDSIPKDIILDEAKNLAYIALPNSSLISVIDMNSAKLVREIKLSQAPDKLFLDESGEFLVFIDNKGQKLYKLEFGEEYISRYITDLINPSKVIIYENSVFVTSRTENKITRYSLENGDRLAEAILHQKPVDAVLNGGNIFILCAKSSLVDVYDIAKNKVASEIQLPQNGFYSKINKISNMENVIITGVGVNKFIFFDLANAKIIKEQPFLFDVDNVVVVDK
jgi:hypothetical protein